MQRLAAVGTERQARARAGGTVAAGTLRGRVSSKGPRCCEMLPADCHESALPLNDDLIAYLFLP